MISDELHGETLDAILKDVREYILSTYNEHYVGEDDIQTIDFLESLGSLDTTARDICIKYLARFGKKEGHNKKDIFKTFHFLTMIYYLYFVKKQKNANTAHDNKTVTFVTGGGGSLV